MEPTQGRRSGGRAARQAARTAQALDSIPFLTRTLKPVEVLDEEGLSLIEANADRLLSEVGVELHGFEEGLQIFKAGGADVDGTRVRFPEGLARHVIQASAPKSFVQYARNPEHTVTIGDPHMVFAPAYGSPFVRDLEGGRRYATLVDFQNFARLTHMSPSLHHGGGTLCEPVDLPVNKRHFDMVLSHIKYHDRPFMGSVTAPERAQDTVDMVRILFGADFIDQNTVLLSLCNANSPMSWDYNMLGSAKVYAENNQASLITPFILAGAMAPVTVAATVTQTLAESMAGMAFCQMVRPGAPVVFGSFASSISMQSGAPTFGTPEPALVLFVIGALARRLGVPFRSGGNLTASKVADYQAAFESAATFFPTIQAGTNFVLHTAGWLEGGLTMGYEKFILDADQASMAEAFVRGVDLSDNGLAIDALIANPPGQHFLGNDHTLANFETAFWRSRTADNNSFEQWLEGGSLEAAARANKTWKQMLAEYVAPALDESKEAELTEWITRRKQSFPDSDV
jgi:trimethylamine--corrinoid protein Co-methyltransferase